MDLGSNVGDFGSDGRDISLGLTGVKLGSLVIILVELWADLDSRPIQVIWFSKVLEEGLFG